MSNVVYATDASFETDVLNADTPVLVDFWAEWCGPCRMIAPILDDLSKEYAGRLKIVKVNVDENSVSAATYGVRGIPTLLLFKNGQLVETKVGALPKGQLAAFIDSNI
jgi:thioredoxin 1